MWVLFSHCWAIMLRVDDKEISVKFEHVNELTMIVRVIHWYKACPRSSYILDILECCIMGPVIVKSVQLNRNTRKSIIDEDWLMKIDWWRSTLTDRKHCSNKFTWCFQKNKLILEDLCWHCHWTVLLQGDNLLIILLLDTAEEIVVYLLTGCL